MSRYITGAVAAIAAAGCLLSGCAAQARHLPSEAPDAAIARFNEQYLKAINESNAELFAHLTDDGHIMIAPNRPPTQGKAAITAAMGSVFSSFRIEEAWMPIETVVSGDLAYQRGTFTVAATPKAGGEPRRTHGNFLRIYRRQPDGSWLMTRDMFSSDQPQP